ncbi:MAG: FlgD immunoglobulin-like domain containing protein [bacterium]
MTRIPIYRGGAALVALAILHATAAGAQVGGAYDLSWNTIDPGGVTGSSGGAYTLDGTAAQLDAGTHSGGAYVLTGGFWAGAIAAEAVDVPFADAPASVPVAFQLHPAAPNPFTRETTIAFDLPQAGRATARVYNPSGALVRTLVDESFAAGRHQASWLGVDDNGRPVAQGIYMLRLEAGSSTATHKLVLTR